ncbi:SPASM domain-containing protein, partial [bacterium]|nr:SPASM domain-containing protein [bacterium]
LCLELAPRSLLGKGLVSLGISLEGPAEVHDAMVRLPGAFDRTTRTLRRIAERKKSLGMRFPLLDLKIVICRETQGYLLSLYNLAENIGMDIISYQQCSTQESSYGIDDAPDNAIGIAPPQVEPIPRDILIPELVGLVTRAKSGKTTLRFNPDMDLELFGDRYENRFPLKQFTCAAAWSIMHVGPYGTVYPCFSIPMGNLRDNTLTEIWNGHKYRQFRQKLRLAKIFPGCVGCCVMKKKN